MSPLERAARALCSLAGNPENAKMDGKPLWQDYLPEARAVIGAIRDPGDEVMARVIHWPEHWPAPGEDRIKDAIIRKDRADRADHWRAMIDALLAENAT